MSRDVEGTSEDHFELCFKDSQMKSKPGRGARPISKDTIVERVQQFQLNEFSESSSSTIISWSEFSGSSISTIISQSW